MHMYTYMCMFAFTLEFKSVSVAVFTAIHPWLFIGFQHVLYCHRWFSHGLMLIHWQAHVILKSSCSVWKQYCYTITPKLFCVFEHCPKTNSTALPVENCLLMNKTHIATCVFLPLFSFFVSFTALFLTVWDTTLCEFRKTQRYPPWFFHVYG